MPVLSDPLGRRFTYLRLSVIEACQFHCSYCLPDGYRAGADAQRPLGLDEVRRLLAAFAVLGTRKLRLTGGEPSLRRDLADLIRIGAGTPGIGKVAVTTNGALLRRGLAEWQAAGLTALNVSVDSLDRGRFAAITGHDRLDLLLAGVEQALEMDLPEVKLNAVLLRGLNDDELPAWLDYLRERDLGLRFIELMRTGDNADYFARHHLRATAIEARLREQGWALRPRAADAGPAREYAHPDYRGRIGIIAPYSADFCAGCNRLRVTARGDLRLCLFGEAGFPLRPLLQRDDQQEELQDLLLQRLGMKPPAHRLSEGRTGLVSQLAAIGG
jgi:cyclic pyranopterin phosphate synthase